MLNYVPHGMCAFNGANRMAIERIITCFYIIKFPFNLFSREQKRKEKKQKTDFLMSPFSKIRLSCSSKVHPTKLSNFHLALPKDFQHLTSR